MRTLVPFLCLPLLVIACGGLKNGGADAPDAATPSGSDEGGAPGTDGGSGGPPSGTVTTDTLVTGINYLGARSSAGFRPWRSGIATDGNAVYWVESGSTPGLYSAPASCTPGACAKTPVAKLTRPSAFRASAKYMYIADTTKLGRIAFGEPMMEPIASATDDIINLGVANDDSSVFWTFGDDEGIQRTTGSNTSIPIYSNGTPVAMGSAGTSIYWAGCDISGQTCAIQTVGQDGTGAAEVTRVSNGFQVFGGNALYLYYAEGMNIHRKTLSTGHDDVVEMGGTQVTDFAIDDSYAYWTEEGDGPNYANGNVSRVSHASKTSETLASSVALPLAIAVSGTQVFVGSAGTKAMSYGDGSIIRLTITP